MTHRNILQGATIAALQGNSRVPLSSNYARIESRDTGSEKELSQTRKRQYYISWSVALSWCIRAVCVHVRESAELCDVLLELVHT